MEIPNHEYYKYLSTLPTETLEGDIKNLTHRISNLESGVEAFPILAANQEYANLLQLDGLRFMLECYKQLLANRK